MQLAQSSERMTVDHFAYTNDLKYIVLNDMIYKNRLLDAKETAELQTVIGQLIWSANQTRPDTAFDVCQLSASKKKATGKQVIHANETIKKVKHYEVYLKYPHMKNIENAKIVVYSDAFNNFPSDGLQGAHLILISDSDQLCAPIHW